jgi:hypothetical protein
MFQDDLPVACLDCGGELRPIKLFGRGYENPISGAAVDAELVYFADADAERSTWLSMFRETGRVHAKLCAGCRRISLYGIPG